MNLPTSLKDGIRPHPSNWTTEPEKANTHCLYCHKPVPDHKPDCVCLRRTVVVEMTARMVVTVPQSSTQEDIEFYLNESSHCSSNEIRQLYEESEREPGLCNTCSRTEFKFLREATEQDHEDMAFKPSESA